MSLAIVAAQQPRDAGRPVGADVTGRVLDGTGQPLAGATVRLSNWSTWNQPGIRLEPVTLTVRRGGTIAGRLLRPDGSPAANVPMVLSARRGLSGDPAATGANGDFRITGVYPGEYRVAAQYFATQIGLPGRRYAPAFHPGTVDPSVATWFRVAVGQDLDVGTFQIVASPATTIRGVVLGPQGTPAAGARVHVPSESGFEGPLAARVTDDDGRFALTGATPGRYTLWASPPASTEGLLDGVALHDVVVAREDLSDVTIRLAPAGRLSGRVEFSGSGRPAPDPRRVRLSVTRDGYKPVVVPVAADGTFVQDFFPGRDTIRASVAGDRDIQWLLQSVQWGGTDLPEPALIFEPGSMTFTGVTVVLSDDRRRDRSPRPRP
jgi:hypothetical protein